MTTPIHSRVYWEATHSAPEFPQLAGDLEVDVAIVGGGMVGVCAARMLKDAGLTVAVVEARRVGQGVSGKATAKVTSQHSTKYQTLEQKFGFDRARLYAEAQEAGLRRIRELAQAHGIDADIEERPAFVYTQDDQHVEEIEKEVDLARRLGLPASLTKDTGLPFDVLIDESRQVSKAYGVWQRIGLLGGDAGGRFDQFLGARHGAVAQIRVKRRRG